MARARFKTKLTKKQKRRNIQVFFVVVMCVYVFTLLFSFGIDIFDDWTSPETYLMALAMLFPISSMLLIPVFFAATALGLQRGRAKRVRDDSTFVPTQDIDYYRDNLSELNPALVSLLIDLDIYGKKDIAATLLRMYNKKAVTFHENGNIIVTAKNTRELDDSESELLYFIDNGKLNDRKALLQWKRNRFYEVEQSGYIKMKDTADKEKMKGIYAALLCLGLVAALVLWGVFLATDFIENIDRVIGAIEVFAYLLVIDMLLFVPGYLLIRHASYYRREDILWERTPLGNETAEKVAGLVRFIHEFSLLSEAKKEQAVLWEDYLVYAIVLEENEQIVKDIGKFHQSNVQGFERFHSRFT